MKFNIVKKSYLNLVSTIICFLLLITFNQKGFAETTVGFSADALPYITGGDSFQVWLGLDNIKLRAVKAKINVPKEYSKSGIKNHEIEAKAFIVDYVFGPNFSGLWIGTGLEQWETTIEDEAETETVTFKNDVFTVGSGYIWKILDTNAYINPWVGAHYVYGGGKTISVGQEEYKQETIQVTVSVKLGWHF